MLDHAVPSAILWLPFLASLILFALRARGRNVAAWLMTATALVGLSLWFLVFVLSLLGADYATAVAAVAKPWNAILLVGFLICMFWHAQLGLQVVLEDYVHTSLPALALQTTVKFIAALGAIVSVFAVARIALVGA